MCEGHASKLLKHRGDAWMGITCSFVMHRPPDLLLVPVTEAPAEVYQGHHCTAERGVRTGSMSPFTLLNRRTSSASEE